MARSLGPRGSASDEVAQRRGDRGGLGHGVDLGCERPSGRREPRVAEHLADRVADRVGAHRLGGTVRDAPARSRRSAFEKLSAPWGRTTWGTPWARAPNVVPPPPWCTTAAHLGSRVAWGTNRSTVAFEGSGPSAAGSPSAPTVTTTSTSAAPSASRTVRNTAGPEKNVPSVT